MAAQELQVIARCHPKSRASARPTYKEWLSMTRGADDTGI